MRFRKVNVLLGVDHAFLSSSLTVRRMLSVASGPHHDSPPAFGVPCLLPSNPVYMPASVPPIVRL